MKHTALTPARVVAAALLALSAAQAAAQPAYVPGPENLRARRWFQDAKFGLFIHWGIYSTLGEGEWVMQNKRMPVEDYEKLALKFAPTKFDAASWVELAQAAGMKYITITAKHHDGFAMFDSRVSDYDVVDRTPLGRDFLKALAEECRRRGVKLFFYYSQLDWHHPDYYPRGETGQYSARPDSGRWGRYVDYMNTQLTELLTGYGEVAGVWFDGWWDKPQADWRLAETYGLIHRLRPAALVGSNHHRSPIEGEDFQMFEKDLPGQNTAGFNDRSEVGTLPLETCETVNGSWGYNVRDRGFKDARELVQTLVRTSGHNANLLLNVGPTGEGLIQEECVTRLREMGSWLSRYGEAIYGTRGGPITPRTWGVSTQRENTVYVHLLDWDYRDRLWLPLEGEVASVRYMKSGERASFTPAGGGMLLEPVPPAARDQFDTILVIELAR